MISIPQGETLQEYRKCQINEEDVVDIRLFRKPNLLIKLIPEEMSDEGVWKHFLQANHHIGIETFGDYQVIVKPKIEAPEILYLLNDAYLYSPPDLRDEVELFNRSSSIQAIFVYWFLNRLSEFVKRHFARNFVLKKETLPSKVKGKLLVSQYIKSSLPRFKHYDIPCQYFDLTVNTIENQIIRFAMELCRKSLHLFANEEISQSVIKLLNISEPYFGTVELKRIYESDFNKIRYVGRFNKYEEIHKLCRILIKATQPILEHGALQINSFTLDMNELFERFIFGILSKKFSGMRYQSSGYGYFIGNKRKNLIPDGLLDTGDLRIIFDAKYKDLYDIEFDDNNSTLIDGGGFRVKNTDIYQMIGYLNSEEINGDLAILIYPKLTTEPVLVKKFNKSIYIIGIDLKNISKESKNLFTQQVSDIINSH